MVSLEGKRNSPPKKERFFYACLTKNSKEKYRFCLPKTNSEEGKKRDAPKQKRSKREAKGLGFPQTKHRISCPNMIK